MARRGADALLKVPAGTQILEEDGETLIADLTEVGQTAVIARGGNGGFGNLHFTTSTNRAPRRANPGLEGVERRYLAAAEAHRRRRSDRPAQRRQIDLSGHRQRRQAQNRRLPLHDAASAGSAWWRWTSANSCSPTFPGSSKARMRAMGWATNSWAMWSAAARCCISWTRTGEHAGKDYKIVRRELAAYGAELDEKREIVALSKIDAADPEHLKKQKERLKRAMASAGPTEAAERPALLLLSSATGEGVTTALRALAAAKETAAREEAQAAEPAPEWRP